MEFQKNTDISFTTNELFMQKLTQIPIEKYHRTVAPNKAYAIESSVNRLSEKGLHYDSATGLELQRKSTTILDFGDHCVGRVSLSIRSVGSPPDAPVKLKLSFGETLEEVQRPFESYHGELSSSWLQEELLTLDVLPSTLELKRRFAFRFAKIEVIDTSPKYHIWLSLTCKTESSADPDAFKSLETEDELLKKIDLVAQKTLAQCMQEVFEDGPKRDRRLWLGDLRLQALANYKTFHATELVKNASIFLLQKRRMRDKFLLMFLRNRY